MRWAQRGWGGELGSSDGTRHHHDQHSNRNKAELEVLCTYRPENKSKKLVFILFERIDCQLVLFCILRDVTNCVLIHSCIAHICLIPGTQEAAFLPIYFSKEIFSQSCPWSWISSVTANLSFHQEKWKNWMPPWPPGHTETIEKYCNLSPVHILISDLIFLEYSSRYVCHPGRLSLNTNIGCQKSWQTLHFYILPGCSGEKYGFNCMFWVTFIIFKT